MTFKIGSEIQTADAGAIRGHVREIACKCWFTRKGEGIPLMIKLEDEDGMIRTIREIEVRYCEQKSYSGIPSTEYGCEIVWEGVRKDVKLIFLQEECRWIMTEQKR
ncbi:hypothetical protein [Ruminococcus gauvreauii]|uniref:Uncharacterized protein n=1 Tax=Ruminococcus gauvreauii TaxID=438033 RepID=A0ABY5VDB7_9FIRM|nr:hypothetical protein [Ruminococcus gauvreauii]UWP58599.1 hypothetical protein NQ502_14620 [Ruminococcus gauvreauii]